MNRKGFTLVELIAMMVVISVLMLITVPNISGIIKKNRESVAISDINKMVGTAETNMESKDVPTLNVGECVVFTLRYLDGNGDINVGVNGGDYDKNKSVVVVSKQYIDEDSGTSTLKYYIGLLENKSSGSRSSSYYTQFDDGNPRLIDYDIFSKKPEDNIPKVSKNGNYYSMRLYPDSPNSSTTRRNINNYAGEDICSKIVAVYIK